MNLNLGYSYIRFFDLHLFCSSLVSVLNSRPYRIIPTVHSIADYEDLLFSCLQSTQLLYQSWLRSPTPTSSSAYLDSFPEGTNSSGSSTGGTTQTSLSTAGGNNVGTASSQRSAPSESQAGHVLKKGLALAPLLAVIRSIVMLSDLFTSREQFIWLARFLQESEHFR